MSKFLTFLFSTCFVLISLGQSGDIVDRTKMQEFEDLPSYDLTDGYKYNEPEDYTHPDFGMMTFNSPMNKHVVEVISKRKLDERYYIDLDDPTFFYIEKAAQPINFYEDGYLRAIDPSLHRNGPAEYISGPQPVRTKLDLFNRYTQFSYGENFLRTNNYQLLITYQDGSETLLYANWSDIEVTNFEAYITNIFPNVDMRLEFDQGSIKSDLIIKQDLNAKELRFIDNLDMSNNLSLYQDTQHPIGQYFIEVNNQVTGETDILLRPALTYDAQGIKNSWASDYEIHGSSIHIICDSSHLHAPGLTYPLTVDPTFISVGPVASGFGVMGSLFSPAFCSSNLVVNFPGGSTPWDSQVSWTVFSDFCAQIYIDFGVFVDCWMSEAQVWITSGCGGASPVGAPGTIWTCTPGCNSPGTWNPTLPFNSSGTQSLAQCYPATCSNQNLTYTINMDRTYCPTAYGYDDCVWANSYCQSLDQWSVTVQGRSVETLGNTATGNGYLAIYDSDCAGTQTLDPTPQYGVGPYTYSWSTGGAGPTEVVPGTVGTYTVDVTDACGTTVTATFDIGCPLSVDLKEFGAFVVNSGIQLEWKIENTEGIEFFEILKSGNGQEWRHLSNIELSADNSYTSFDNAPNIGENYYQLIFHMSDGASEKSDIVKIDFTPKFEIFPNPASKQVNFVIKSLLSEQSELIIYDLLGRDVMRIPVSENQIQSDISALDQGNYFVRLEANGEILETHRLTVK